MNFGNPTFTFTIEGVLSVYYKALGFIADYKRLKAHGYADTDPEVINSINSAGSELSTAIEHAIKLHMQVNWELLSQDLWGIYNNFNIHDAIKDLYAVKSGRPGPLYNSTVKDNLRDPAEIKFHTIDNRKIYSNGYRHEGVNLKIEDILSTKDAIRDFLNCYITSERLKEPQDLTTSPQDAYAIYDAAFFPKGRI